MDWYDFTQKYNAQTFSHDGRLSCLPEEWQCELAALSRLELDVNNGGYLQFLENWGRTSYLYASRALEKIGASRMKEIVDECQLLVDEHVSADESLRETFSNLLPNPIIGLDGRIIKEAGSILPDDVLQRVYELSYEFMDYPDNIPELGLKHYGRYLNS